MASMTRGEAHAQLVHDIRLHLGRSGRAVLFVNVNAALQQANGRKMVTGLTRGAADLIGWVKPGAVFLAVEVKTGRGVPSDEQLRFLRLVRDSGGRAGVARSVDDADRILAGEYLGID